ncbi:MAG: hypothetical protein Q4C43_08250 [Prevotella sp.]|nr:hypothetical protein [Prevotella sp.]MDO4933965.1 hypothetical protein [Prevotella sp.]
MKKLEDKGKNVPLSYFFGGIKDIAWYVGCVSMVMLLWVACNNGAKTARTDDVDSVSVDNERVALDEEDTEADSQDDKYAFVYDEYYDENKPRVYEGGHVCVSENGLVSVESGTMPCGGNSPECWSRWTITDKAGKKHKILFEYGSYQDHVHSIKKSDGSTYYIVNCYCKEGGIGYEWLEAYKIVGDTIHEVNVADGGSNIQTREFRCDYSLQGWYMTAHGGGYDWILEYDSRTKNLYVPITVGYDLIDRYDIWHFNGSRFVKAGSGPNRLIHRSLAQYESLLCYATTKDYIVRVDSLDTKELRYASWKRPKTMADKPDMVITGGKRLKGVNEVKEWSYDYFSFKSGNSEYLVDCHEVKKKGWRWYVP